MEVDKAVARELASNAKGDIEAGELTGDEYPPEVRIMKYLDEDEQPHYLIRSLVGGARKIALVIETNDSRRSHYTYCVVATDKGVHLIAEDSPGWFSGWTQTGHWNIPYKSMEAIDYGGESTFSKANALIKENRQGYYLAFVTANRSYYVNPAEADEATALVNYVRNRINEPMAVQNTESDSVMDQLERLEAMRDRGAISDSEFDEQKAKLLDRL